MRPSIYLLPTSTIQHKTTSGKISWIISFSDNVMTYEEKFELIVKAIAEAKKYAREEYYPKLYYNEESGLKGVDLNQIHDILLQLQDDDKIITVKDTPTALKSAMEQATEGLNGAKRYFTIDILDNFEEWFKNYLTNQQKEAEQATLPIISHKTSLSDIADEELVKFFEDERRLLNKLLQICNEKTRWVLLMYPAHLADNDPDKASFNRIETLKDLQDKYKVFRKFTPPLNSTHLPHVQIIKAWVNFQRLKNRVEDLHDEIESWKGQAIGKEQQKKELLRRLQERFNKYPNQEVFTYSERILGAYRPENYNLPLGYSLNKPDQNRPDIRYRFMQTMRALEKEGYFTIESVEIDFFAEPQPTGEAIQKARAIGNDHEPREFYSPKHCKVTLRLIKFPVKQQGEEALKMQGKKEWSEDFKWQNNSFVFGKYGRISLNSKVRIALFRELTEAKGGWVTVKKLKEATGQDESYVRPTIGQVERSMKPELKKYISIPSTGEDDLQPKPSQGAYRIKFTPKSL